MLTYRNWRSTRYTRPHLVAVLLLGAAALLVAGCSYPNHRRSTSDVTYSRPQPRVTGTYELAPEPGYEPAYDDGAEPGMVIESAPYEGDGENPAASEPGEPGMVEGPIDPGPDGVAARAADAEAEAEGDWKTNPDPFAQDTDPGPDVVETDPQPGTEPDVTTPPATPDDAVASDPEPDPEPELEPLPEPEPMPETRPEPPANTRKLSKDDLTQMHEAGLSDATILAVIKASWVDFEVTPALVISLGRAGLSDVVIQAVIARSAEQDAASGR